MVWRLVYLTALAIFLVRGYFFPAERWWELWGAALAIGAMLLHLHEKACDKRAEEAMEENTDVTAFYLSHGAVCVGGIILAFYCKLGLWSLAFGPASALAFFVLFMIALLGEKKEPEATLVQGSPE